MKLNKKFYLKSFNKLIKIFNTIILKTKKVTKIPIIKLKMKIILKKKINKLDIKELNHKIKKYKKIFK